MRAREQQGSKVLGAFLVLVTLGAVVWPALAVAWSIVHGALATDEHAPVAVGADVEPALSLVPSLPLLVSTLAWAIGIGVGATILAWPAAWFIRRRGWGVVALLATPLLLPSYLAYSAYGILRAPGSWIGEWIEGLVKQGVSWAPTAAGRIIAGVGLALWAWPIAAIVLGASVRRMDESVLDALRLEASPLRRRWEVVRLSRAGIIGAIAAVGLVMLGSAIPLHLAQVPTYAIKVWLDLTLAPGSWRVWAAAWPLLLIAIVAGWLVGSRLVRHAGAHEIDLGPPPTSTRGTSPSGLAALIVWTCSVLVPLALFASTLFYARERGELVWHPEQWKAVARFWKLGHESVEGSVMVAALVGVIAIMITGAVWQGLSAQGLGKGIEERVAQALWVSNRRHTHRRDACATPTPLALFSIRALLIAGLMPGVLVGSAIATAANLTSFTSNLTDSPLILVLGHTARFGCVPALIGCWLAAIEPMHERELRALDGAIGLRGWAMASLPVQAGALLGAGLAAAALSLHEIEAAVVLQPPGSPSLAQMMLNYLHQLRMQDLSAAAVVLVSGGIVVAGVAGVGVWWTARVYRPIRA